jgi:hypothetical protein
MKKKTGYIGRWPNQICKVCGKKKVRPEKVSRDRWRYPTKRICFDCLNLDLCVYGLGIASDYQLLEAQRGMLHIRLNKLETLSS